MSRAMDKFCADLRITYRQFDFWCRRGWVYEADRDNPDGRSRSPFAQPGSGQQRRLSPAETAHLRRMADLVNDGMTPARAAQLAWRPSEADMIAQTVALVMARQVDVVALELAWSSDRGECA